MQKTPIAQIQEISGRSICELSAARDSVVLLDSSGLSIVFPKGIGEV